MVMQHFVGKELCMKLSICLISLTTQHMELFILLLTTRLDSPLIQDIQDHHHTVLVSGSHKIVLPLASERRVPLVPHVYVWILQINTCFYVLYSLCMWANIVDFVKQLFKCVLFLEPSWYIVIIWIIIVSIVRLRNMECRDIVCSSSRCSPCSKRSNIPCKFWWSWICDARM